MPKPNHNTYSRYNSNVIIFLYDLPGRLYYGSNSGILVSRTPIRIGHWSVAPLKVHPQRDGYCLNVFINYPTDTFFCSFSVTMARAIGSGQSSFKVVSKKNL
jgi:hypothetical protein